MGRPNNETVSVLLKKHKNTMKKPRFYHDFKSVVKSWFFWPFFWSAVQKNRHRGIPNEKRILIYQHKKTRSFFVEKTVRD